MQLKRNPFGMAPSGADEKNLYDRGKVRCTTRKQAALSCETPHCPASWIQLPKQIAAVAAPQAGNASIGDNGAAHDSDIAQRMTGGKRSSANNQLRTGVTIVSPRPTLADASLALSVATDR